MNSRCFACAGRNPRWLRLSVIFALVLVCAISWATGRDPVAAQETKNISVTSVRFANGRQALDIPIRNVDRIVMLRARLNDSVDVDLMLDSGLPLEGVMLFDPEIGELLGLKYSGKISLGGGGSEGAKTARVAQGGKVGLRGAEFPNQVFYVCENVGTLGEGLSDGIIGATVFKSSVVELDFDRSVMNLYDREVFSFAEAGEPIDMTFVMGIPIITAQVAVSKDRETKLKLLADTGAGAELILFPNDSTGIRPSTKVVEGRFGVGLSGEVVAQYGRIHSAFVGPFTFTNTLAVFPTNGMEQVRQILGQDGFFGIELMRRFHVAFDYSGQRLYLKPNARFRQPFEWNMAGIMFLTLPDGKRKVFEVISGSPAAEQDVAKNDLVVAVNGKDVSQMDYDQLEGILRQDGAKVTITVERDGKRFDRTLVLRRLI